MSLEPTLSPAPLGAGMTSSVFEALVIVPSQSSCRAHST